MAVRTRPAPCFSHEAQRPGEIRVLFVEDDRVDLTVIQRRLEDEEDEFFLLHAESIAEAIECLEKERVDVCLLDLTGPGCLSAFTSIQQHTPGLPVVVLTDPANTEGGIAAVQAGAQNYLVKGNLTGAMLASALLYAIERQARSLHLGDSRLSLQSLAGSLPMCPSCREVRDGEGFWKRLEGYIDEEAGRVSQAICPACSEHLTRRSA